MKRRRDCVANKLRSAFYDIVDDFLFQNLMRIVFHSGGIEVPTLIQFQWFQQPAHVKTLRLFWRAEMVLVGKAASSTYWNSKILSCDTLLFALSRLYVKEAAVETLQTENHHDK
ncbi:hypothetical protein HELRODRAFT_178199 [Helobdella robusta]|uniref:Uncharacterized protein n=1 Tax=Helobdella robusta TaxID=6412 RepID=T1FCX6_HELRO|nr:hypothetical protein HELRODRAFT_178199 [Helobdella robusta]ESN97408.1 hypothetical protein HELRODRAFT_178199 [Helobdella robusta]